MNRALMLQTISIVIGVIRLTTGKNEKVHSSHVPIMIYREEAVGLKSSNYTKKKYNFCEYVKFLAIS